MNEDQREISRGCAVGDVAWVPYLVGSDSAALSVWGGGCRGQGVSHIKQGPGRWTEAERAGGQEGEAGCGEGGEKPSPGAGWVRRCDCV